MLSIQPFDVKFQLSDSDKFLVGICFSPMSYCPLTVKKVSISQFLTIRLAIITRAK